MRYVVLIDKTNRIRGVVGTSCNIIEWGGTLFAPTGATIRVPKWRSAMDIFRETDSQVVKELLDLL